MIPQNITALERNMATAETLNTDFLKRRRGKIGSLALFSRYRNAATMIPAKMNKAIRREGGMFGFSMKVKARNMELNDAFNVIIPL